MTDSYFCHICFDNHTHDDGYTLLSCGHTYCLDCLFRYLEANIADGFVEPCCFLPFDTDWRNQGVESSVSIHKGEIMNKNGCRKIKNDFLLEEMKNDDNIQYTSDNETMLDEISIDIKPQQLNHGNRVNEIEEEEMELKIKSKERDAIGHATIMMQTDENDDTVSCNSNDKNHIENNSDKILRTNYCKNDICQSIVERNISERAETMLNNRVTISIALISNTDTLVASATINDQSDNHNDDENDIDYDDYIDDGHDDNSGDSDKINDDISANNDTVLHNAIMKESSMITPASDYLPHVGTIANYDNLHDGLMTAPTGAINYPPIPSYDLIYKPVDDIPIHKKPPINWFQSKSPPNLNTKQIEIMSKDIEMTLNSSIISGANTYLDESPEKTLSETNIPCLITDGALVGLNGVPLIDQNLENDMIRHQNRDTINDDHPTRKPLTEVCNMVISNEDIYQIISKDSKLLKSYEYFKFMKKNANARECPYCRNLQIGI